MIRRSGSAVKRVGQAMPSLMSAGGADASISAAALVGTQSSLANFAFQDHSKYNNNTSAHSFGSTRHLSFFNSSSDDDSGDSFASSAVLDSTSKPPIDPLAAVENVDPASLVELSAVAEAAAVAAASEGAWIPTKALMWALETVHDATGLAWWQSIALTTVGMRVSTFPLMLMQIKNTYRLSQARPEIERLLERLKEEQAKGNPNAMSEYQQRVMLIWQKYNANPMKSMASLFVQAPMFIGFFSALRGLAGAKVPSVVEGGAFWFTDLTIADPFYLLPIIASSTFLLTVEVGAADGMEGQTDVMKKRMKNIMRGVAVVILPFTLQMPAGVFMYWITSNFFSLGQMILLKIPAVKSALGLPNLSKLPSASVSSTGGGEGAPSGGVGRPVPTYAQKPSKQKN